MYLIEISLYTIICTGFDLTPITWLRLVRRVTLWLNDFRLIWIEYDALCHFHSKIKVVGSSPITSKFKGMSVKYENIFYRVNGFLLWHIIPITYSSVPFTTHFAYMRYIKSYLIFLLFCVSAGVICIHFIHSKRVFLLQNYH